VNIILDADINHNADDVGDAAMMWAMAAKGEFNVLAIIVSSTNDYSGACEQAVASYYGHPNVPIGANHSSIPGAYAGYFSYYTQQVAQNFGFPGKTRAYYPDALTVYRQALASAADHSVYIVATGYYHPLMHLLQSGPDSISPLTGMQLVTSKVKRLIPAAGRFPDSTDTDHGNLSVDPDSASYVVANWPSEIVWMPDDQVSDVTTGPAANADPTTNPIKLAYNLYCSNGVYCNNTTPGWAQTALLFVGRGGVGTYFGVGGQNGSTIVWDSTTTIPGRSIWSQTPNRQHAYLTKITDASTLSAIIDPLIQWIPPRTITQPPVANPQSISTPSIPVAITLTASDPQGASLTYTVATQPSHGTLTGTPPNLTYTPATGYIGSDAFTFWASNGYLQSSITTISITVTSTNQPPVASSQSVNSYGAPISITLTATDPNNDPLTYPVVTQPTHGSLSGVAPNLTYTAVTGYTGTDAFTFLANDGRANSNIATVTITVDANGPPYRVRINAGGPAITDANGNTWQADTGYSANTLAFSTTSNVIANTGDPRLYQTERYASDVVQYSFSNLPNGTYTVNLHFAEIASNCFQVGCRVFDVLTQGTTAIHNLDIFAAAGGPNVGIARSTNAVVTNGILTIAVRSGQTTYPILSAIDFVLQVPNSPLFGTISGTVTRSGLPVAGAVVSRGTDTAITDSNGNYLFTRVAPGSYSVFAAGAIGVPVTQPVNVTGGSTTTASFVLPAIQPPVANSQSVTTASLAVPITLTASDPQGAPLSYTLASQPAHGTLAGVAPTLTYTPATGYTGNDSFTFTASNGFLQSNTATVSITVTTPNHPPVANAQTVNSYGNAVAITLSASDADNDPLTYTIVAQPANGSLSGAAPNLTYTPVLGYSGTDSFTFLANDGRANSNIATVTIVVDANAPPYRMLINAGGPSLTDPNGKLWQADTGSIGYSYTFSTTSPISTITGDPRLYQTERYSSNLLQYSFSNLPNGTYTVNLHFAEIASGCFQAGCRVFNVQIQGTTVLQNLDVFAAAGGGNIGIARSASAVVTNGTLTIAAVAGQTTYPILSAIDFVLQVPNSPLFGSISGTVTRGVFPLVGAVVSYGTESAITDSNGNYLFTRIVPGSYSLAVTTPTGAPVSQPVNVTGGSTTTANFALPAIQPPVANSQTVTTAGAAVSITLTGSDPQGASLSYTVATQPAHGTLSGTAPSVTYTPTAGYVGSDSFTFIVSNGYFQSTPATVSLTITTPNHPPVANAQAVNSYGNVISITLSATDADNDPLTYAIVTQPAHGSLSGTAPSVTYTPVIGYSGTDTFTFRANDERADSNVATVTITIDASGSPYRMRINAGGPSFKDVNGNAWQADAGYTGYTYTFSTTSPITARTGDPTLYQTERYASNVLQYSFSNLPNGIYTVNLHFAEIASSCFQVGCRVFNVQVQGTTVLQNLDVFAAAGGAFIGIARSTSAVVANGTLTIAGVAGQTTYPILSGIDFVLQVPNSPLFGSISGTVTRGGSPVAGATVSYGTETAISDSNGNYLFTRVAPGTYTLTASSAAGQTLTQSLVVTGGTSTMANFALP
jgi:protocatechuate 3,4-dioxygenase beta subunit